MNNTAYISQHELTERAQFYAQDDQQSMSEDDTAEWVVFQLEKELFTLNIKQLDEISTNTRGVILPGIHSAVLGLGNVRGKALLLVDLAQVLNLRHCSPQPSDKQRILIIKDSSEKMLGLLIDNISRVTHLNFSSYQTKESHQHALIDAVSKPASDSRIIARINLKKLTSQIHEWISG